MLLERSFYCFQCGEKGHRAQGCRSSLVCFTCGKVGHRTITCRTPTLSSPSPSPTAVQMTKMTTCPTMKFYSNRTTRELRASLTKGVVLFDQHIKGPTFIRSHLKARFPLKNWEWIPRKLAAQHYLIDPPDEEWRKIALRERFLCLGDVTFPLEPYSSSRFTKGSQPKTYWLNIMNLPHDLWSPSEIRHVAEN